MQQILQEIYEEIRPLLGEGEVASYIPQLAHISPQKFGMAVITIDGDCYSIGDAQEPFSIQSISKLFTLTMAMQNDDGSLWKRTGREPSGNAFNSLVQLEYENGIPRNPFINAGALVVTDLILTQLGNAKQAVLDFICALTDNLNISFNLAVAQSEASVGFRNKALAYFLKSFGNIYNNVESVLDAYFHHCSIEMSCLDLAKASLYLANKGLCPTTQQTIVTTRQTKYLNSLLLTCGTYDAVGDFAYRVGLPAKSGVGGGILAVMPNKFGICVWSPGLSPEGNSKAGTMALDLFTTKTGISIF